MSSSHYKTLRLAPKATLEELKRSYKTLALQHHPDKNPNNVLAATEKFKKISASYGYLLKSITSPPKPTPKPAAQPDTRASRAARSAPEPEPKPEAWKKKSKAARRSVPVPDWRRAPKPAPKPAPQSAGAEYGHQSEYSDADSDEDYYARFEEPREVDDDPDFYIFDRWKF